MILHLIYGGAYIGHEMKNKIKYSERKLAFIDVETTGLSLEDNEIIEIAAIIYDRKTDKVIDEWEDKIKPSRIETASKEALIMNGYNNNPSLYKKKPKSVLLKFNDLVKDCITIGQNIMFDIAFIEKAMLNINIEPSWDRHRRMDLMSIAWPYVQDKDLPGLGLKNFCDHFNLSNAGEHTALIDCRRTLGVYRCLMNIYRKT